jgi:hypothetical protein
MVHLKTETLIKQNPFPTQHLNHFNYKSRNLKKSQLLVTDRAQLQSNVFSTAYRRSIQKSLVVKTTKLEQLKLSNCCHLEQQLHRKLVIVLYLLR